MRKGIDISHWQGNIDFARVAENVDFAIIREGYRKSIDDRFLEYVSGCREHGITIAGVYHFCYATSAAGAREEALSCLENVRKAGLDKHVIIFFDLEYDSVSKAKVQGVTIGKAECIEFTWAFCGCIEEHGYKAGIYSNMDYYRNMYDQDTISRYVFWLADYSERGPAVPCAYHQYTSSGQVPGINGNVDMDYCYDAESGKGEENMAVLIGSARSNEFGGINGGAAGDQTGGEVSTQDWYLHTKGWVVIRPKDPAVAEKIAQCMEWACANDNIGYCQDHRITCFNAAKNVQFDCRLISSKVEVDCSELIRICVCYAGIQVGDFNTAAEVAALSATGAFEILRDAQHCSSSNYLKRGDILVTQTKGHTVVVLNNGVKVAAEPAKAIGWHQDAIGWWYVHNTNGSYYTNEWALIDHHWYLFGKDGYMLTGWQQWNGEWYYLNTEKGSGEGQCWHEKSDGKGAMGPWYVE